MKVLVTANSFGKYDGQARTTLERHGFEIFDNPYGRIMNEKEFSSAIQGMDIVILGTEILDKKVIEKADTLKFVSRYGVGTDNMDLAELKRRNIGFAIARNCNSQAVADYTIGLMLDALRGISLSTRNLYEGKWAKVVGVDLYKKTVGIIGLGSIGMGVAKRLSGFDCKVLGYDVRFDHAGCQQYHVQEASLEEIYQQADIITLHLPALPNDKALIGEKEISCMKHNVVLINTARTSLIDADALIAGLQSGKVFAGASDAQLSFTQIDQRYHNLDRFTLTPHNAAVSLEASIKMSEMAVENILNYFQVR